MTDNEAARYYKLIRDVQQAGGRPSDILQLQLLVAIVMYFEEVKEIPTRKYLLSEIKKARTKAQSREAKGDYGNTSFASKDLAS